MSQTPDRFPGEREDEGILLDQDTILPTVDGEIRYYTGQGFKFFEEGTVKTLTGFDTNNLVLEASGSLVYTGDGVLVTKT